MICSFTAVVIIVCCIRYTLQVIQNFDAAYLLHMLSFRSTVLRT